VDATGSIDNRVCPQSDELAPAAQPIYFVLGRRRQSAVPVASLSSNRLRRTCLTATGPRENNGADSWGISERVPFGNVRMRNRNAS
jgi:hypothetical protein